MNTFQKALQEEKIVGYNSAKIAIAQVGIEDCKAICSAKELPNNVVNKNYGYWSGWINACLGH